MADQLKFRVTPEQIEAARAKLAEAGFPISGDTGSVEEDGYLIGYSLAGEVLILEIQAKPRFVPMWAVKSRVRSALTEEGLMEVR